MSTPTEVSDGKKIPNPFRWVRSKVATAILATVLFSLAITIGVLTWISVRAQTNMLLQQEEDKALNLHNQFESQIEARETLALALSTYVANDPEIQGLFSREERDDLISRTLPGYLALDAAIGVPQYQFHLPPATSFLRLHQLDKSGDDLSAFRFTVLDANRDQIAVAGPEIGKGGMGIRGVVPVSYEGNHVGTVEFGTNIGDEFLLELSEKSNIQSAMFFDTTAAKVTTFEQEQEGMGENEFILFASSGLEVPVDEASYRQVVASGEPRIVRLTYEDTPYAVYIVPFADYSGDIIGVSTIYLDRSQVLADISRSQWTSIGIGFLLMLISGTIVWFQVNQLVGRPVAEITNVYQSVGMGDYSARSHLDTPDELGVMSNSLNSMLDNTLSLIQSSEEREQMQSAIMKLLEEIAGVADRDLTVEAEVTADMTGAIADSFNMMIVQLREVIGDVQDTTLQVSASANEVQATTEHLAIGSEEQASQIVDTSAALDEMAVSIQQVSENAALSATVSEQSTANARQGSQSVQNTIDGMGRIREQVQETSKRIKRLGESSQEIGEIVQLIGDIADRTSILALNASIQAAMAGDAGRGFAVVAEEVERLAERSTEATKQIDNLIRTIQNETYEAVAAMETMTNEVVAGSDLAQEAGTALQEIETVSVRLSDLIQQISLASKQQARGSETIARSMNDIAEVTQQTAAGTKQAAVSISNLSILADDLRSSVSTFKLPSGNNGNDEGYPMS